MKKLTRILPYLTYLTSQNKRELLYIQIQKINNISPIIIKKKIKKNKMDETVKKKIINIRQMIKKQKYKQALDEAQVQIYKYPKVYQIHLMAALCYDKLGKLKEAQKSYLEVLQLKPEQPNAIKSLCDLYTKTDNVSKSTQYLQSLLKLLKNTDKTKYIQNLVKLVDMYKKNEDMENIDRVFKQMLQTQNQISQQFVAIALNYFQIGIKNQCFCFNDFLPLGLRGIDGFRKLQPNASQKLNYLLIQIMRYLYSVKIQYKMSNKDLASCIYQMKQCFPQNSCFLMLFLLDEYCVSQNAYNAVILQQIYLFLSSLYNNTESCYKNLEMLEPECFVVTAILSYEYLAFMKEFFILDELFNPFYQRFIAQITEIESRKVREEYQDKINRFILKQCRNLNKLSQTHNIQNRLENLKYRIVKLDGSYLEEVVAKMAMNCFIDYEKLSDMKNLLKIRINNLKQGQIQPHLYKYYYDYLIKIVKLYKSLDEQKNIYQIIQYIYYNDPQDLKYVSEYYWIQIIKNYKKQNNIKIYQQNLHNLQSLLPRLIGVLKSQTMRRKTLINIILEQYDQVLDGFKIALGIDRSFQNLQCIGLYYFNQGNYQKSIRFLKQAFVIRQNQYHLNRAIFIGMIKTKQIKDAYNFLQRIYEGFNNVYWVNYALGINSINNKRIQSAYKYLTAALEAFMSGISKSFKFSYEKTIQGSKYSLIYMIVQNQYSLLSDYIVIPQKKIYQLFPMASSLYFEQQIQLKQIKIQTQLGQVLKLLGRNKSSYNHLYAANYILEQLPESVKKQNILQVISTKKQYGTMLFYVRAYKQAQEIFRNILKICQELDNQYIKQELLISYQSEIHSLLFEVSVTRLNQLMKFQSYEVVEEYINKFTEELEKLKNIMKKPSLNYFKAKYQFYILCFLHNQKLGIDKSVETIQEYLKYFGLNSKQIQSDGFYNILTELKNEQRIIIKQCLQDYYVLKYMQQNSINNQQKKIDKILADNLLPLIQLFPTSSVFYIVYGMVVKDSKLKIAAFLKCIQIDKESPISVDLLASLFLKEKDYLTACKLFLKSLQIDVFNTKSYVGLCTCLYVLIGSAMKRGDQQANTIIRRSLNKINSYMQFLRLVDPSQNYHILKFLKTLISDQPIKLFQLKAGLEQSRKLTSHKYSEKLLYKLLENSTLYLKEYNVWKKQGREEVFIKYLSNMKIQSNQDLYQIGKKIIINVKKQIQVNQLSSIKSTEIRIKIKCKMLNEISTIGNLFCKSRKLEDNQLQDLIKLCHQMQQNSLPTPDQQLNKLQKGVKDVIIAALIRSKKQLTQLDGKKLLQQIITLNHYKLFKNIPTFTHIQIYLQTYTTQQQLLPLQRYIYYNLHIHPCDKILHKMLLTKLLVIDKQNNKNIKKIKQSLNYQLQTIHQMNLDQFANNTYQFHKKYAILFNVCQPNAWIGFIWDLWKKKKETKWIKHVEKFLGMYQNNQSIMRSETKKKAKWMLIQMYALKYKNGDRQSITGISKQDQSYIEQLSNIFVYLQNTLPIEQTSAIIQKFQNTNADNLLKYLVPQLIKNYQYNQKLQQILNICIQYSTTKQNKGFYYLLKFISISRKFTFNQQQFIQQYKNLFTIVTECQGDKSSAHIHTNALTIMKCIIAFLSLNNQQLQLQLNNSINNRFATYSDQLLINFFEILKQYKEVQQNHKGENVFQKFTEYINLIIFTVKEPVIKGFFCALKAMAGVIVAQQENIILSRELKYAMLLSPESGKSILNKR